MSKLRFKAVREASKRIPLEVQAPPQLPSEYYGKYVFNRKQMSRYLSKDTLKTVFATIDQGVTLQREIADHVAAGMKRWAIEMGATHYTHWFQPLTEGTAEKHDSFIDYVNGPSGDIVEQFSGKYLAQQEPDASSFPSGGIRNTFEARGYTAWDPSSPAFIIDNTLCIPTVFISYTGEALDYKTPLLKALSVIDKASVEVCKLFYPEVKKVYSYLGWEQEYFLVDQALWDARPDLSLTDRTLMGHESAKNQQLEDHYFGAVPPRVVAFMREVEFEAYKYGIPLKTRHNQFGRRSKLAGDVADAQDCRQAPVQIAAARKTLCRCKRIGQAQQLVVMHRYRHRIVYARKNGERKPAVHNLSCEHAHRGSQAQCATQGIDHVGGKCGTAGNHLGFLGISYFIGSR